VRERRNCIKSEAKKTLNIEIKLLEKKSKLVTNQKSKQIEKKIIFFNLKYNSFNNSSILG